MKRRILPLSLIIASMVVVYACSSDETPATTTPPDPPVPLDEAGKPIVDGAMPPVGDSSIPDTSNPDTFVPPSGNPIQGIAAPTVVLNNIYTEGPQWFGNGLYFSELKADGPLIKLTPPSTVVTVRTAGAGTIPLGTTYDGKGLTLLTLEVNNQAPGATLFRTSTTANPIVMGVETPPRTATPLILTTDAGTPPAFDSPNDVVVRKSDGTIYLSDPGYQTNPDPVSNQIWRIKPVTNEVFKTDAPGRPNGIALSPNDMILYVSFTNPTGDVAPTVVKYPVAVDGALGAPMTLAALPPGGSQMVNSLADGLAVDTSGNVYVATRTGVEVLKPDGSKWGSIPTPKIINGLAFGGADMKTLYMTSPTGLLSVTVKLAGIAQ